MHRSASGRPGWQRGFLGFYALRRMADGPVFVSDLAHRIADRTQGAWRPSAGAVYPAVWSLVDEGYARARKAQGRPLFSITERGRRRLRTLRDRSAGWRARFARGGGLLLDLLDPDEVADHLLDDLRARLALAEGLLSDASGALSDSDRRYLAAQLRTELGRALVRLGPRDPESARSTGRVARRGAPPTAKARTPPITPGARP